MLYFGDYSVSRIRLSAPYPQSENQETKTQFFRGLWCIWLPNFRDLNGYILSRDGQGILSRLLGVITKVYVKELRSDLPLAKSDFI